MLLFITDIYKICKEPLNINIPLMRNVNALLSKTLNMDAGSSHLEEG